MRILIKRGAPALLGLTLLFSGAVIAGCSSDTDNASSTAAVDPNKGSVTKGDKSSEASEAEPAPFSYQSSGVTGLDGTDPAACIKGATSVPGSTVTRTDNKTGIAFTLKLMTSAASGKCQGMVWGAFSAPSSKATKVDYKIIAYNGAGADLRIAKTKGTRTSGMIKFNSGDKIFVVAGGLHTPKYTGLGRPLIKE